MAEIETKCINGTMLNRRIDNIEIMKQGKMPGKKTGIIKKQQLTGNLPMIKQG